MALFNLKEADINFSEEEINTAKAAIHDLSIILQIKENDLLDAIDIGLKHQLLEKENIFVTLFLKIKQIFQNNATNRQRRSQVKSR